jgi:DNA-binding beta-propeller fold protein YncE
MKPNRWITRTSLVALALLSAHTTSVRADEGEEHSDAPKPVTKVLGNVEKSVWASDLSAPHGLTRDFAGNVYATEFTAGRIVKLSPDGKIAARFGDGLKSPAWIVRDGDRFLVTERKANRVLAMSTTGQFTPLGQEIIEPLGIAVTPLGRVVVVAHTTSRIFDALSPRPSANAAALWRNIYSAPSGKRQALWFAQRRC